jgi:predicted transcriptional regulator
LLNSIERVAVETAAAVAYGCHFAKGNSASKEAIDRISGSGVFARDPDSLLVFTRHEEEGAFTVEPILRNFQPTDPFVVRWNYPVFEKADDLNPDDLKQVVGRKKAYDPFDLLLLISDNDELNPITVSEWSRLADIPRKSLSDYLAEMRQKGWVKTIGEGTTSKQAITPKGKEFLSK